MSNNIAKLQEYDFVVVLDASGSMAETDMPGGKSRWNYMQESLTAFASDIGQLDSDGFDLVVFGGSNISSFTGVNTDKLKEAFATRRPMGSTPLTEALTKALELAGKSDKKDFIIVFTDGIPDDKASAARVIIEAANKQETDDSLTILFVQVGKDAQAAAYLKSLDDDLTGAKFDIVDAKTLDEAEQFATTADLIIAAIND